MISCENVVKSFDNFIALDTISFSINSGSIYGLIGSNGAGKSTLMRCIAGIYNTDKGNLTIDGEISYENPLVKQQLFLVADEPYFIPQANMRRMKNFYSRFYPNFSNEIYEELMEAFSLPEQKRISTFSKGMKRQAAFLFGMAVRPNYLMLDECFDGLDPVKRQVVRKVLCDAVADRNMTAIISSHNLKELDELCDTVGILHKGQLVYSKDLDSLKGEVHKIEVVFEHPVDKERLQSLLPVMAMEVRGRFYTLIARGTKEIVEEKLSCLGAITMEAMPLTLEEVFLYEMQVMGYDAEVLFKD